MLACIHPQLSLGTRLGFRRTRDVYMFIRPCFMTFSVYTMTFICLYAHNGKGSIREFQVTAYIGRVGACSIHSMTNFYHGVYKAGFGQK